MFAKRKMPHDFFMTRFMPFDEASCLTSSPTTTTKGSEGRHANALWCHLIPMVNAALENYNDGGVGVDAMVDASGDPKNNRGGLNGGGGGGGGGLARSSLGRCSSLQ